MATKVFVHGNPEVDAIWSLLVAELRARGVDDVVLLSPPGFGAPTPDGWAGDMAAYRDWLVGELERIGRPGQGIDLVGHDWGAGHVFGAVPIPAIGCSRSWTRCTPARSASGC